MGDMKGKGVKINTTEAIPSGDVLSSTLDAMEEFDMNVINDTSGSHDFNSNKKSDKK